MFYTSWIDYNFSVDVCGYGFTVGPMNLSINANNDIWWQILSPRKLSPMNNWKGILGNWEYEFPKPKPTALELEIQKSRAYKRANPSEYSDAYVQAMKAPNDPWEIQPSDPYDVGEQSSRNNSRQ